METVADEREGFGFWVIGGGANIGFAVETAEQEKCEDANAAVRGVATQY